MENQGNVQVKNLASKNIDTSNNTEGLNKAEARAKRKEAKKQNKVTKKDDAKSNISNSEIKLKSQEQISKVPVKNEPNKTANEDNVNNKPPSVEGDLSKAELKAKRRAIQEAQRQAKLASKTDNKEAAVEISPQIKQNDNKPAQPEKSNETAESKAELRAKRRAVQEAQRLAKQQAQETQKVQKINTDKSKEIPKIQRIPTRKDSISVVTGGNLQKQVQLFNHLYFHHSTSITKDKSTVISLHASIVRLGVRYMSHNILGSNARCLALLAAIKDLITDYRTPPQEELCRSLENNIQSSTNYLQKCRPLAVSMTNAIRFIKYKLTNIDANLSDEQKKSIILESIDTYINDEIGMADKAISITVQAKISKNDVILTYGCSSVVTKILLDAHKNGKEFSVIVVDARPLLEGRELLRRLVNAGIKCSYVLINATSFIMGTVTKVLLGAHSLLANGCVMSRAGTAQIALVAQAFNKPVLVCCETYKFCERVQTDSIVHNEIGDPDKLILPRANEGTSLLANWKENKFVTPLNLMYDITPPHLVTAVVTELAILPCTSVPVILRVKPTELAL